jgi:hypothetical protein
MASGDEAVQIVDVADVAVDAPIVHVKSAEKSSLFSFLSGTKSEDTEEAAKPKDAKSAPNPEKKENDESSPPQKGQHVHEGEGIKTTYDVEEDVPPSLLEQLKRIVRWNGR